MYCTEAAKRRPLSAHNKEDIQMKVVLLAGGLGTRISEESRSP